MLPIMHLKLIKIMLITEFNKGSYKFNKKLFTQYLISHVIRASTLDRNDNILDNLSVDYETMLVTEINR